MFAPCHHKHSKARGAHPQTPMITHKYTPQPVQSKGSAMERLDCAWVTLPPFPKPHFTPQSDWTVGDT